MTAEEINTEEILQAIRDNRSSEANFDRLLEFLEKALASSQKNQHKALATDLQNVKEKYAAAYRQAKEAGGTAWPEFENFVTQFERSLTEPVKDV